MLKYILILFLFISINSFSQKEGQIFCEGDPSGSYFPLLNGTKYIVWSDTYYLEKKVGEKEINGKIYSEYSQTWESGDQSNVFFLEENGIVYQYEEAINKNTLRLPKNNKEQESWQTADGLVTYEIISLKGELKTPVCNYIDLLVLKSTFENGIFIFYYQKGYEYVGATKKGQLISYVAPQKPIND